MIDEAAKVLEDIAEQRIAACLDAGEGLHPFAHISERTVIVLIPVKPVIEAVHMIEPLAVLIGCAAAGVVQEQVRLDQIALWRFPVKGVHDGGKDRFRHTGRTAAHGADGRGGEVDLVDAVKSRHDHVLRDPDAMLRQHGTDIDCHDIVGAEDRIRELLTGEELCCGSLGRLRPEMPVADHILREGDAVFLHDLAVDLHAFIRERIIGDAAHEMRMLHMMVLENVPHDQLKATAVVKPHIRAVLMRAVGDDDRDVMRLGILDDTVGSFAALDLLVHDDDDIGMCIVDQFKNGGLGIILSVIPVQVGIDHIHP